MVVPPLYDGATEGDRTAMVLPLMLPPSPSLDPDVAHANEILVNGYRAARGVLDLVQPDINQVRYHQERIRLELVPLLDAISESTSDAATRSWCFTVTEMAAHLFNQLTQREASIQHRFTVPSAPLNIPNAC